MIFELYLSKLNPNRKDLWQRPKKVVHDPFAEWYDNVPIGKDPLNGAMKALSLNAKLSKIYTNHCIRSTAMETLDEGAFEARHIMAQSGHKSESSIKVYAKRCPAKKKKEMSYCLANKLNQEENQIDYQQQETPAKKARTETTTHPTENAEPILPENFDVVLQESDEIPDDQLVSALEMIEKENAHLFQNQQVTKVQQNQMGVAPVSQNLQPLMPANNVPINVNNVANYAMAMSNNPFPSMQFHNSNVTINYNFQK